MEIELIEQVIERVLKEVNETKQESTQVQMTYGIYEKMEEAIACAKKAQEQLRQIPLDVREEIIARIKVKILENKEKLAVMAVEETGMGKIGHKILKHELVAKKTPGTECIKIDAWSGDQGLTIIERGPYGVVGAITPSTNPSETVFCNAIGMIAAGNTVVFNPHPGAIKTTTLAIQLINQAAYEVGRYHDLVTSIKMPTIETGNILFTHKDIDLLVATGGSAIVELILRSGKKAMAAGAGNPPVLVDETAHIAKAAEDIINGATFDNNLPCIAEKEVIVVDEVADELLYYMLSDNDCYMLRDEQINKLASKVLIEKNGKIIVNRRFVGKDATFILREIGIEAPSTTRCIIFEGSEENVLIKEELMMPILGIIRVKDVDEGIKVAIKLEGNNRHSAHMHSSNVDNLTRYGKALDTAIFVKNAPSYAAIGFGGEGFTTFTIASKTGEGLTNALSFTRARRCVMANSLYIR